jgi:hypothetical protein
MQSYTDAAALCDAVHGVLHEMMQPGTCVDAAAFLDRLFAARPVAALSRLLVWLQQRLELLQLPALAARQEAVLAD